MNGFRARFCALVAQRLRAPLPAGKKGAKDRGVLVRCAHPSGLNAVCEICLYQLPAVLSRLPAACSGNQCSGRSSTVSRCSNTGACGWQCCATLLVTCCSARLQLLGEPSSDNSDVSRISNELCHHNTRMHTDALLLIPVHTVFPPIAGPAKISQMSAEAVTGCAIKKGENDPAIKPDSEYPPWLFELIKPDVSMMELERMYASEGLALADVSSTLRPGGGGTIAGWGGGKGQGSLAWLFEFIKPDVSMMELERTYASESLALADASSSLRPGGGRQGSLAWLFELIKPDVSMMELERDVCIRRPGIGRCK